jgi:hypothetical protein
MSTAANLLVATARHMRLSAYMSRLRSFVRSRVVPAMFLVIYEPTSVKCIISSSEYLQVFFFFFLIM